MRSNIHHASISVRDFDWYVDFFSTVFEMTVERIRGEKPSRQLKKTFHPHTVQALQPVLILPCWIQDRPFCLRSRSMISSFLRNPSFFQADDHNAQNQRSPVQFPVFPEKSASGA